MFADQHLGQLSLEDLANDFSEKYDIPITKQSLQERFNEKAVNFLMSLLNEQLKSQLPVLSDSQKIILSKFNSLKLKDSTRYGLPEDYANAYKGHGGISSSSQISIQYEYDLLSGKPVALQFTSACRNDQEDSKQTLQEIEKGDLLIRDLAYVSQAYLTHITEIEAFYLNRLNTKWTVLDSDDKPIDFSKILKKIKKYSLSVMEIEAFIKIGKKKRLKTRLVVSEIPSAEYKNRIQKAEQAAKSKGYNVTDEYKLKAALNLFITNIPKDWLDAHQVRETYSLRWQIELVFKVWKSQGQINQMKKMKLHRFQCQLIARFLWLLFQMQALILLQQWCYLNDISIKCSHWKFYKTAFRLSPLLRNVVFSTNSIISWIEKLYFEVGKKYLTETKKNKYCTHDTLKNFLA